MSYFTPVQAKTLKSVKYISVEMSPRIIKCFCETTMQPIFSYSQNKALIYFSVNLISSSAV